MNKKIYLLLGIASLMLLCGCGNTNAAVTYKLAETHPVGGRQGICTEGGYYWVSGSGKLEKYDSNWKLIAENTDPFAGYSLEVNHIGDIDVYNNELYLGVEYFMDGEGKNIQVAVYDGDTESSEYLYMYDLDTGDYKGKLKMQSAPKWIQGVAYHEGKLYVTCDDGNADDNAPDHMYRIDISENRKTGQVSTEKVFDDVIRQGEIEGLSFCRESGKLLLLYNRGARIVAGMPSGFYEGYEEEIHEVFVYDITEGE